MVYSSDSSSHPTRHRRRSSSGSLSPPQRRRRAGSPKSGNWLMGCFKMATINRKSLRVTYFFGEGYTYGNQIGADAKRGPGAEKLMPRGSVDAIPEWIRRLVVAPLVDKGLIPSLDWPNMVVINDYKPRGFTVSHINPPQLFERPIHAADFFSDSNMSFGVKWAFNPIIQTSEPIKQLKLSRGVVTTIQGFAADGITHCIRPQDVQQHRVVIILQRVKEDAPRLDHLPSDFQYGNDFRYNNHRNTYYPLRGQNPPPQTKRPLLYNNYHLLPIPSATDQVLPPIMPPNCVTTKIPNLKNQKGYPPPFSGRHPVRGRTYYPKDRVRGDSRDKRAPFVRNSLATPNRSDASSSPSRSRSRSRSRSSSHKSSRSNSPSAANTPSAQRGSAPKAPTPKRLDDSPASNKDLSEDAPGPKYDTNTSTTPLCAKSDKNTPKQDGCLSPRQTPPLGKPSPPHHPTVIQQSDTEEKRLIVTSTRPPNNPPTTSLPKTHHIQINLDKNKPLPRSTTTTTTPCTTPQKTSVIRTLATKPATETPGQKPNLPL